jgi:hypothetical protein
MQRQSWQLDELAFTTRQKHQHIDVLSDNGHERLA